MLYMLYKGSEMKVNASSHQCQILLLTPAFYIYLLFLKSYRLHLFLFDKQLHDILLVVHHLECLGLYLFQGLHLGLWLKSFELW